jgi:hypothetical protein
MIDIQYIGQNYHNIIKDITLLEFGVISSEIEAFLINIMESLYFPSISLIILYLFGNIFKKLNNVLINL